MAYVGCHGEETHLANCSHSTPSCFHSEDAGVRCPGIQQTYIFVCRKENELCHNFFFVCLIFAQNTQVQEKTALMEIYDLEVEPHFEKEGWRYAMKESGGQCVTIVGKPKMLKWHADNLDFLLTVSFIKCCFNCHR